MEAILTEGALPVTVDAPHPRNIEYDKRIVINSAAALGYEADVGAITSSQVVRYTVYARTPTDKEQLRDDLSRLGFATYADYVRDCARPAGGFNVSHMGTTRRQAHGRIRYALSPRAISLRKVDNNTSRVDFI